jgi:hypothetical protein
VRYLLPFSLIRDAAAMSEHDGRSAITLPYEEFRALLRRLIADIDVEEEWYLRHNEDVAEAVKAGQFESAKQHYVANGFFEGRLPFRMKVDDKWYLQQNPDVAELVRKGTIESAQAHFNEAGYREGRPPWDLSA